MRVTFEKEYLRELYETGKTADKKHRSQPEIIKAYAKCIYRLEEASAPEDLYKYHSLHFEALKGNRKGLFSVRVNNQYRIEFEVSHIMSHEEIVEVKIIVCNIIELSNHYG